MAVWTRLAASAGAAVLVLTGCSYSAEEPGLFPSQRPSEPAPKGRFLPQKTNPKLPVAGERIWVSGGKHAVTVRIAVHAVRRAEGATVLDWSITPLKAAGFDFGDSLPGIELGLVRPARNSDPGIFLLDTAGGQAYQPLSHESRRLFNHCLCTPLWVLQGELRIGETRLLQLAFPPLADAVDFLDVSLATVAPFAHVPVTPIGSAPVAREPTDLARAAEVPQPRPQKVEFHNPIRSRQLQRIQVIRVGTAPGRTTLDWTLTSANSQFLNRILDYGPPVAGPPPPADVYVVNNSPASGPVLQVSGKGGPVRLGPSWLATEVNGRPAYECLCTELGLWSTGLRDGGRSVNLVTNYAELPPGTRMVDVDLPGFGTFRKVPVNAVEDAARRVGPAETAETGRWIYSVESPSRGWSTNDWPTDTPDPAQLTEYRSVVETMGTLPGTR